MSSVADVLRTAKASVAAQRLHEAFACFCRAKDMLSSDYGRGATGGAATRLLRNVDMEVQRMSAYLKQDPWAALGLDAAAMTSSAPDKHIKKAYRKLARTYHPDKNQHTEQLFIIIKDAYEQLSDPSSSARRSHASKSSASFSSTSSTPTTPSANEARRRKRATEAAAMAAAKRRNMELRRRREAALKRQREAKVAAEQKRREEIMQRQMQEQIKRAWQFVHRQHQHQQDGGAASDESPLKSVPFGADQPGEAPSIASKLASIQARVMEKMNEIRRKSMENEQEDEPRSQGKEEPGEKRRTKPETAADLKRKDKAAAAHKIWIDARKKSSARKREKNVEGASASKKKTKRTPRTQASDEGGSFNDGIRVRASKPDEFDARSAGGGDHEGIRVGPKPDSPLGNNTIYNDGIRVEAVPSAKHSANDGIRVGAASDTQYSTGTASMEFPEESNESIGSFFSDTMGVKVKVHKSTKIGSRTKKKKDSTQNDRPKKMGNNTAKAEAVAGQASRKEGAYKKKTKDAGKNSASSPENSVPVKSSKVSSLRSKVRASRQQEAESEKISGGPGTKNGSVAVSTAMATEKPKIEKERLQTKTAGPASEEGKNAKSSSITIDSANKTKKKLFSAKEARVLAASKKNHSGSNNNKSATSAAVAVKLGMTSSKSPKKKKKKKKKKAAKTMQKSFQKVNEESFVEQVRNMWRSAVLETVGLGTDAAFLRKIGIDQDQFGDEFYASKEVVAPKGVTVKPASTASSSISSAVPESDEPVVKEAPAMHKSSSGVNEKSIPTRDMSSLPVSSSKPPPGTVRAPILERGNPSVFSSNPEEFSCKRCGQHIAVSDMISHANHCGDSMIAQEAIERAVESRASTDAPKDDQSGGKDDDDNGFICQLCNLKVFDADMATHPATCPGLNPTGAGMFWGSSAPSASSSSTVENKGSIGVGVGSSSSHLNFEASGDGSASGFLKEDMLDGGGAIFLGAVDDDFSTHFGGSGGISDGNSDMYDDGDDGDDDEEPLIGGGGDAPNAERNAVDGGMDFLGFSQRWDENHRNMPDGVLHQSAEHHHPGGFFSATGVFHVSESDTPFSQNDVDNDEKRSDSDISASDYSAGEGEGSVVSSSDYTDEDEDVEPMLASESQLSALERALQGNQVAGTDGLLVYA